VRLYRHLAEARRSIPPSVQVYALDAAGTVVALGPGPRGGAGLRRRGGRLESVPDRPAVSNSLTRVRVSCSRPCRPVRCGRFAARQLEERRDKAIAAGSSARTQRWPARPGAALRRIRTAGRWRRFGYGGGLALLSEPTGYSIARSAWRLPRAELMRRGQLADAPVSRQAGGRGRGVLARSCDSRAELSAWGCRSC
jgi:hypothetical protein